LCDVTVTAEEFSYVTLAQQLSWTFICCFKNSGFSSALYHQLLLQFNFAAICLPLDELLCLLWWHHEHQGYYLGRWIPVGVPNAWWCWCRPASEDIAGESRSRFQSRVHVMLLQFNLSSSCYKRFTGAKDS